MPTLPILEAEKPRDAAIAGGACGCSPPAPARGGRVPLLRASSPGIEPHGVQRLAIRPRNFVTVLKTSVIPLSIAESRGGSIPT
jgi:hypothetical protein